MSITNYYNTKPHTMLQPTQDLSTPWPTAPNAKTQPTKAKRHRLETEVQGD